MSSKTIISTIFMLLLSISIPRALSIDVDITTLGAKADEKTDINAALTDAWKQACGAKGASKVIIPKGIYLLSGPIIMAGPCQGTIELAVEGTLKAPESIKGDTWVSFEHVDQFTMSGGGIFDGQGQSAWGKNDCAKDATCDAMAYNLRFNYLNKALIHDITSLNSKNFHVNVLGCNDITFKSFTITAPATSLNTDGIHIGRSKGVNVIDSKIGTGDDCISIGDGSQQVHITNVKCGPGHGISIGSLGRYPNEEPVSGIFVQHCTLSNTDNGLRIKSWPGLESGTAADLHFEDIIMENVKNPILIDQMYCPYNQCNHNSASKVKISKVSFKRITGTSATPLAVQLVCSSGLPCESIELEDVDLKYTGGGGPATSECSNVKPKIAGTFTVAGCEA
eukprot:XP_015582598.1 exopolygalacturonase-like [Ricinus communis]